MCKIVHWLKCHITQTFHKLSFIWVIKIIHPTPNECFQPWKPFMHRGRCLKDHWTHFHHNKLLWEVCHSSRFFSAALHSWSTQKLWPSTQPCSIWTGKAPTCACFSSTSVLPSTASFPPYLNQGAPRQVHQFFSAVLTIPQVPPRAPRDVFTRHANWKSTHRSNADVKFANGAASVVIINNERAHWESKTLTSWFRTTQSPSSDNYVCTPHTTTHTRTGHSACLSMFVSCGFLNLIRGIFLVYFKIFFEILHLFFFVSHILSCTWSSLLDYILCTSLFFPLVQHKKCHCE